MSLNQCHQKFDREEELNQGTFLEHEPDTILHRQVQELKIVVSGSTYDTVNVTTHKDFPVDDRMRVECLFWTILE